MGVYTPTGGGGGGGSKPTLQAITGATTISGSSNIFATVNTGAGNFTITLDSPTSSSGLSRIFRKVSTDSNTATLSGSIDTLSSMPLKFFQEGVELISDGTVWRHIRHDWGGYTPTAQAYSGYNGMFIGPGVAGTFDSGQPGVMGAWNPYTGASGAGTDLDLRGGWGTAFAQLGLTTNTNGTWTFGSGIRTGDGNGNLGASLYTGNTVPPAGTGSNGDFWFRTDTPATANQRLYIKSAGAWIGIL